MLGQCRKRWSDIKTALDQNHVVSVIVSNTLLVRTSQNTTVQRQKVVAANFFKYDITTV